MRGLSRSTGGNRRRKPRPPGTSGRGVEVFSTARISPFSRRLGAGVGGLPHEAQVNHPEIRPLCKRSRPPVTFFEERDKPVGRLNIVVVISPPFDSRTVGHLLKFIG